MDKMAVSAFMKINGIEERVKDINKYSPEIIEQATYTCCGMVNGIECRCKMVPRLRMDTNRYYLTADTGEHHIFNCEYDRTDPSTRRRDLLDRRGENFDLTEFFYRLNNGHERGEINPNPGDGDHGGGNHIEDREQREVQNIEVDNRNPRNIKDLIDIFKDENLDNIYGIDGRPIRENAIRADDTVEYRIQGIPADRPMLVYCKKTIPSKEKNPKAYAVMQRAKELYPDDYILVYQDILDDDADNRMFFAVRLRNRAGFERMINNEGRKGNAYFVAAYSFWTELQVEEDGTTPINAYISFFALRNRLIDKVPYDD